MTDHFISIRRKRMLEWMDANPNVIHTSSYDETIDNDEANLILKGDFDGFDDALFERLIEWEMQGYLWDYWNGEFASAFGYDAWSDIPESVKDFACENRTMDTTRWTRDMICHWHGNVTATILKPGTQEPENLIYAPSNYVNHDGSMAESDRKLARYLIDAFGVQIATDRAYSKAAQLRDTLEVVYGGYDREQMLVAGRVDMWAIYESRKTPDHVIIGPEDKENILFYEHFNGCGNMGTLNLTKTRKMPARLSVDGSYGYGVDSCYGFTGSYWRHEIRVA